MESGRELLSPQAPVVAAGVDDLARLVHSVAALTETTELAVFESPHLSDDPPPAVLALGVRAPSGALRSGRGLQHRPNLTMVEARASRSGRIDSLLAATAAVLRSKSLGIREGVYARGVKSGGN